MTISLTVIWLCLALLLMGVEMLIGTLYLLALALGALGAALCAFLDLSLTVQCLVAAMLTIGGAFLAHVYRSRRSTDHLAVSDLDAGHTVTVKTVRDDGSATVSYRGASWTARSKDGTSLTPGIYTIARIDGNTLLLTRNLS